MYSGSTLLLFPHRFLILPFIHRVYKAKGPKGRCGEAANDSERPAVLDRLKVGSRESGGDGWSFLDQWAFPKLGVYPQFAGWLSYSWLISNGKSQSKMDEN